MDPASVVKQSDLNPPEKPKISVKYKHIFLSPVTLKVQIHPILWWNKKFPVYLQQLSML